jgi:coproporphyrinogen III oxidase
MAVCVMPMVSAFVQDVARGILPSWTAIAQRRRQMPFSEEQRKWQLLRWALLDHWLIVDSYGSSGLPAGGAQSPAPQE